MTQVFSREEHELLAATRPGTPMGELLRSHWMPALMSDEVAEPDGAPVRVRLLGEDFVAFRDSAGRVGMLAEHCRHRGASLFLGANVQGGLRCCYHGWKYDVSGACIECPTAPELAGSQVARTRAAACHEAGGVVWAYLGRGEAPALPKLGWLAVTDGHRYAMKRTHDCHWLQALEVDIDSGHVPWLHSEEFVDVQSDRKARLFVEQAAPVFEVDDREYGLAIAARRDSGEGTYYWRVNHWLMPWYTVVPSESAEEPVAIHAWVPIDDGACWVFGLMWHPGRAFTEDEVAGFRAGTAGIYSELIPGSYRPRRNISNLWEMDREAQRTGRLAIGIEGNQEQDDAITESMGPAYDRTRELLVGTDAGIIETRRRLLAAAGALGTTGRAFGVEAATYDPLPVSIELPHAADWRHEIDRIGAERRDAWAQMSRAQAGAAR